MIFLIFFSIYPLSSPRPVSIKIEPGGEATLEINGVQYKDKIIDKESVYDFMQNLEAENKISFKYKDYGEMGKFIEEINGVKNSGEKNWIYYINGKRAETGVSNYKLKPDDKITWKYENYY